KGNPAVDFIVELPLPLVVPNPEHLTSKEIEKLVEEVKKSNPNSDVKADDKGNVTVTDKATGESVLIPVKDLTVKDFTPVKPTEKVPVKDKSHLTLEEQKQVVDNVKAKNPGKEVTVGADGTATVTDPNTGISQDIPGTDLVNQDFTSVKPTEKVPVKDKAHLTPEEKKQVADKVKDKNPGKEVTVGDEGTATVTDPNTGISHDIPGTELVNQDFELVKPTEKVPAKKASELTQDEKDKVKEKVQAKNPGKDVTVGADGTATVTDPNTGISHDIPGTDLVNQDFEPVKPTEKVPVKDKAHLTSEEKKQVADKVKDKNPGKEVTVGDEGTATVTDPNTGISHDIPGTELVNQDFELVKPTEKVPAKKASELTQDEKDKVKDKVQAKNPGKDVTVGADGTATVTDPNTGISHDIPGTELVNQDFDPVKPTEKVPVKDLNNLSKDEQDKVKESVEKANPGKDVIVASDGNVTITNPETNVTHNIPRDELLFAYAKGEPEVLENPEFNGGVNAPDSPIHEVPDFTGGVNAPDSPIHEVPEFNGGVNGEPETQPEVPDFTGGVNAPDSPIHELPEFNGGVNGGPETQEELPKFNGGVNTPDSPIHERPDFAGGVNGELPEPTELPKIQLIITKWIDENGNELKPADAKAPAVLGESNEAFEHGEIEDYVFVRTETKGDVVTHVFRKVSPVRPTGDGQQGPATPSADTNPRPDTVTPAEVPATQPAEQPSQTVEVPAQLPNEVSETNPSVSQPQAVLPNTGTKADRATGAFGVLSLLGAFGLLFAKKKKDDEEEA
ncbi:SIALI-17 repeat-containing surface protein, partial [Streptococcus sp. 20925_1_69]|uniref:SIALI-17 repeat-containing surface protein n=1 Tax=Streptococcus sp. 20925_1_69 TaxID=3003661 RepID=UPI00352CAC02